MAALLRALRTTGDASEMRKVVLDAFRAQVDRFASKSVITALDDGENESVSYTYETIDLAARRVASLIVDRGLGGERILLCFPSGADFVVALLGCIYAGSVPVPAYPPEPNRLERTLARFRAISRDAGARGVLAPGMFAPLFAPEVGLPPLEWIRSEEFATGDATRWRPPTSGEADPTLIQYTSGSTSSPKGVVVTHAQLVDAVEHIVRAFKVPLASRFVTWLPLYHDMGLIGNLFTPLLSGGDTVLMPPHAFLQRPMRWMRAITKYRPYTTGSPNFGFGLVTRKATEEEIDEVDLSSVGNLFAGAEPNRRPVIEGFINRFARVGARIDAIATCYGLAEATLCLAAGYDAGVKRVLSRSALAELRIENPTDPSDADDYMNVGYAPPGVTLKIVNYETGELAGPGRAGELWAKNTANASGYWRRDDINEATFAARLPDGDGPYLRTGDIAFIDDAGRVYIVGRFKDIVKIAGRNHYAEDVEDTVSRSHPDIRPGCIAAFAITQANEETMGIVVEVERRQGGDRRANAAPPPGVERRQGDRRVETADAGAVTAASTFAPEQIISAIRRAVSETHQVRPSAIVLIKPSTLHKTSSGKVQRAATKKAWAEGKLEIVAQG